MSIYTALKKTCFGYLYLSISIWCYFILLVHHILLYYIYPMQLLATLQIHILCTKHIIFIFNTMRSYRFLQNIEYMKE